VKKFLFVYTSVNSGLCLGANHGIAFLVPILKRFSYDVRCLSIREPLSDEEFTRKVLDYGPSIVGFTSTANQFKYLKKYSIALRGVPGILKIAGGAGVTLDPEWVLNHTAIDGVCIGEGEGPISKLLRNIEEGMDVHDTEGFFWMKDGKISKRAVSQFTHDLAKLDFPDYSIFERDSVVNNGALVLLIARGCPNNCSYCCNKALSEVYPSSSKYFRIPPVEYSINMIRHIIKRYPEAKTIVFADDLLTADKKWFTDFAEEYIKHINLPYAVQGRVEFINHDIVRALKRSGCRQLSIGIESGNEELRSMLLNRKHSNKLVIERSGMVKAAGIDLFTFTIMGFPGEGIGEMRDTLRLVRKIRPASGICSFFYPYKNTRLYEFCKEKGLLLTEEEMLDRTNFNSRVSIRMPPAQEKTCIYFKKRLSLYFLSRSIINGLMRRIRPARPDSLTRKPGHV
jgi:radical SAM superfamily enzyme YgiQ (UPF0313 family)